MIHDPRDRERDHADTTTTTRGMTVQVPSWMVTSGPYAAVAATVLTMWTTFASLPNRVDAIEARVADIPSMVASQAQMEVRLTKLENRLDHIAVKLEENQREQIGIARDIQYMRADLMGINVKLDRLTRTGTPLAP